MPRPLSLASLSVNLSFLRRFYEQHNKYLRECSRLNRAHFMALLNKFEVLFAVAGGGVRHYILAMFASGIRCDEGWQR